MHSLCYITVEYRKDKAALHRHSPVGDLAGVNIASSQPLIAHPTSNMMPTDEESLIGRDSGHGTPESTRSTRFDQTTEETGPN